MSKGYISGLITGSLIGINAVMAGIIFMDVKGFVSLKALDPDYIRRHYLARPAYRPRSAYGAVSSRYSYGWVRNKCDTCKHRYTSSEDYPCYGCTFDIEKERGMRWEPNISCTTCKYKKHSAQPDGTDVCTDLCKNYSEWEPANDEYEGGEDD